MKIAVVIPAFNEGKVIDKVLKKIPQKIAQHKVKIIVINDGSTDDTEKVVRKNRQLVITHPINRGLGAALATGFAYARKNNFGLLVTLDGDGQHDPQEIAKLIKPILKKEADFVVGTRVFKQGMPKFKQILTLLASLATFILTGVWTTDSQSGFRAFSKKAITLIDIQVDRMEVSSDFFRQAKLLKLKIVEIPIKPIYTRYSIAKGQSSWNSLNIIGQLTFKRILE